MPKPKSHKVLIVYSVILWALSIPTLVLINYNVQFQNYYLVDKVDGSINEVNDSGIIISTVLLIFIVILAFISSCYCGCCKCCDLLVDEQSLHTRLEQTQMENV
jgi:hypothetical protein